MTNHAHDRVDILMHRTACEAQGLEARTAENLVATSVMVTLFQLFVVRTINFDDQSSAEADEVRIIAQQRRLPSKVKAVRSQRPKPHPQANFPPAHRLPQRPSTVHAHDLIPHPARYAGHPPRKGEGRAHKRRRDHRFTQSEK